MEHLVLGLCYILYMYMRDKNIILSNFLIQRVYVYFIRIYIMCTQEVYVNLMIHRRKVSKFFCILTCECIYESYEVSLILDQNADAGYIKKVFRDVTNLVLEHEVEYL